MREKEVLERAFAMPLTNPSYPPARIGSSIANI
jgi:acetoacetate decarboxylase